MKKFFKEVLNDYFEFVEKYAEYGIPFRPF